MTKAFTLFLSVVFSVVLMTGLARAEDKIWTDEDFMELGKPATESLPVGTEITQQNWEKYKDYMPLFFRTIFKGDQFFKWPPDAKIIVGPPTPIGMPKSFVEATEKYGGSATLVPAPNIGPGAMTISGYKGGLAFPNPQEPDRALKILYNSWFSYAPAVVSIKFKAQEIDRFGNLSTSIGESVVGKSSYVTDPGYPEFNPLLPGIYHYVYNELMAPEQSKYTSVLVLSHNDPADFPEMYSFVPSLRRVLRLSPGAVCAPLVGTDQTNDDDCTNVGNCPQIPLFEAKLLGEKKMLFMVNMKPEALTLINGTAVTGVANPYYWYSTDADLKTYHWLAPKPTAGNFELRDVYVLAVRRLPTLRNGYCYGTRVYYIDKETLHSMGADNFDSQQRYWKGDNFEFVLQSIPGTKDSYFEDALGGNIFDFQNYHSSTSIFPVTKVNQEAGKYNDVARYGTAAGLQQVMQ